jgi:hypothetical protein
VTQAPTDVPSSVLAQLGNRVQHALRAFTPNDADNLRKAARTFPVSDFYDVEEVLQSLGIGEALVTVLTPRGVPSPLAATRLIPPDSAMSALSADAFAAMVAAGALQTKYGATIDRQSAHEIITGRIASAQSAVAAAAEAQRAAEAQAAAAAQQAATAQQSIPPGYPGLPPGAKVITRGEYERQVRAQARQMERERKAAEKAAAAERRRQATAERAAQREREQMIRTGGSVLRSVLGTLFGGGRRR